jgi:hypothetical protein
MKAAKKNTRESPGEQKFFYSPPIKKSEKMRADPSFGEFFENFVLVFAIEKFIRSNSVMPNKELDRLTKMESADRCRENREERQKKERRGRPREEVKRVERVRGEGMDETPRRTQGPEYGEMSM